MYLSFLSTLIQNIHLSHLAFSDGFCENMAVKAIYSRVPILCALRVRVVEGMIWVGTKTVVAPSLWS